MFFFFMDACAGSLHSASYENPLQMKLFRASALRFRHKSPKSKGFYAIEITEDLGNDYPPCLSFRPEKSIDFAAEKSFLFTLLLVCHPERSVTESKDLLRGLLFCCEV